MRGSSIPRLQELTFIEQAALAVDRGASFEEIRRELIEHMIGLRQDYDGTGNIATFQLAVDNPTRYVANAAEALKELMRLGLVERAAVPSSGRAARHYTNTTFALTPMGERWTSMLDGHVRAAYDELLGMLWKTHPQFRGFIQAVSDTGLVVPTLAWRDLSDEDQVADDARDRYLRSLVARVASAMEQSSLGWRAAPEEVESYIREYLEERYRFARSRQRPDPYPRNRDFIGACEEALTKLAFTKAGCEIDYISHEILRRWGLTLGITNFSYHVAGSSALRIWPTATISDMGASVRVERPVSDETVPRVIEALPDAFDAARQGDAAMAMYVPVYVLRATVCWRLRLPDAQFDRAMREFVQDDDRWSHVPFQLQLDPVGYGSVPPTERPLRLPTKTGAEQRFLSLSLVPRRK